VTVLSRIPFKLCSGQIISLLCESASRFRNWRLKQFVGFAEEKFPGRNAAICAACQAPDSRRAFNTKSRASPALLALVASGKGRDAGTR